MKVITTKDPASAIAAAKTVQYAPGVYYCYGNESSGKQSVIAVVHEIDGGYLVDAEADVISKITSATPSIEEPHELFELFFRVRVGKRSSVTARCIAPKPSGNIYFGHKILKETPSKLTWEALRKREYQIAQPAPEPEPDLIINGKVSGDEYLRM